jgi:tetratricopeptide (TPR) repeat protein
MRKGLTYPGVLVNTVLLCILILTDGCKPEKIQSVSNKFLTLNSRLVSDNYELDILFDRLKRVEDPNEVQMVEAEIWEIWMDSGVPEVNTLMELGCKALSDGDYNKAIKTFSVITDKMPQYAEGWNKRATAYYLRGDLKASVDDINQVLALEERHFGALSGLASIYLTIGDNKGALLALERMLIICPNQPGLEEQVFELYQKLGIRKA